MKIELTPAARQRMQDFLARNANALGIRFGVKPAGCSGYSYVVDLATERRTDDTAIEVDGVPLLVDADSSPLVDGIVVDFVRDGLSAGFVFDNPHADAECGCGESFTVAKAGRGASRSC